MSALHVLLNGVAPEYWRRMNEESKRKRVQREAAVLENEKQKAAAELKKIERDVAIVLGNLDENELNDFLARAVVLEPGLRVYYLNPELTDALKRKISSLQSKKYNTIDEKIINTLISRFGSRLNIARRHQDLFFVSR